MTVIMTQKNVRNHIHVPQNRKILRTYVNFVVSCSSSRWWLYLVLSLLLLSSSVNSSCKVFDTSASSILKWLTVLLVEFSCSVTSYTYMKEFYTLSNLFRCHNNFFWENWKIRNITMFQLHWTQFNFTSYSFTFEKKPWGLTFPSVGYMGMVKVCDTAFIMSITEFNDRISFIFMNVFLTLWDESHSFTAPDYSAHW